MRWPESVHIVIPSYRCAAALQKWLPELLDGIPRNKVCLVDDASKDGTDTFAQACGVELIVHPRNLGKGAALTSGFNHAISRGAAWIVTMDADGQHAVADLPRFLEAIEQNPHAGLIIGARQMKLGIMPAERICSNRITSHILSWLAGTNIIDSQCGYRAYSVKMLGRVRLCGQRFEMESEVILKAARAGFPIHFVTVRTLYFYGNSHISHVRDTLRWAGAVFKTLLTMTINQSRTGH